MTNVESLRRALTDEGITTPAAQEAVLTLVGLVWLLAQDPELRAMAQANDLEHFTLGCRTPAFDQKLALALLAVRDAVPNHNEQDQR